MSNAPCGDSVWNKVNVPAKHKKNYADVDNRPRRGPQESVGKEDGSLQPNDAKGTNVGGGWTEHYKTFFSSWGPRDLRNAGGGKGRKKTEKKWAPRMEKSATHNTVKVKECFKGGTRHLCWGQVQR